MTDEIKTEPTAVTKTEVAKDSTIALIERIATIVDKSVQDSTSRLSALESSLAKMEKSISELAQKPKAMQTPTDLPLKPAVTADEDVGAKVEAPDTYQSNSVQTGITEEDKENGRDGANLQMQKNLKKSSTSNITTTSAQRPSTYNMIGQEGPSAFGKEPNALLKAARQVGYAGLEQIARDIKKGVYGAPPIEERY